MCHFNFTEIKSAANFLTYLLQIYANDKLSHDTINKFHITLTSLLRKKYQGHWYLGDQRNKGSAYRAIIIANTLDPLLMKCAEKSGIDKQLMNDIFLKGTHIYVWVDSKCVEYKIGDEGSIGTLFDDTSVKEWQNEKENFEKKKKVCIDITSPEGHQLVLDHKGTRPVDLMNFLEQNNYMLKDMYYTDEKLPTYFTVNAISCIDCEHEGIGILSAILDEKCDNNFYVAASQLEILDSNPFLCQNAHAIELETARECNHSVPCYDQY